MLRNRLAENAMVAPDPGCLCKHRHIAGVFVTFEEPPEDLRRNLASFGWDIAAWEAEKKWIFVDASPGAHRDRGHQRPSACL